MKPFHSKTQYLRAWDENLDGCLAVFDTMDRLFAVTEKPMVTAMPIMLTVYALN